MGSVIKGIAHALFDSSCSQNCEYEADHAGAAVALGMGLPGLAIIGVLGVAVYAGEQAQKREEIIQARRAYLLQEKEATKLNLSDDQKFYMTSSIDSKVN